jgi:transcriptional regulator with XRE-family HTH domain
MTKSEFVERLKSLRASKALTQAAISAKLDISQRLYEYYEMKKVPTIPEYENLIKLANFLIALMIIYFARRITQNEHIN